MIGKICKKRRDGLSSVRDLVHYITSADKTKTSRDEVKGVWFRNMASDTPKEAISEMQYIAECNSRTRHPLMHMVVSWPEHETPDNDLVLETAETILNDMGLDANQAIFSLHKDTENYHLHIAANRVRPEDRKVITPAKGWTKNSIQTSCRKLELKHGLTVQHGGSVDVIDGKIVHVKNKRAAISTGARDFENYSGEASQERRLKQVCTAIFKKAENWDQLHDLLGRRGVVLNKKGSGGVLVVNSIEVKLSRIHRDFTWNRLQDKIGPYQERKTDRQVTASNQFSEKKDVQPIMEMTAWDHYAAEKEAFFKTMKNRAGDRASLKAGLDDRHLRESAALKTKHESEREKLNQEPMPGKEKNRQRHLLKIVQMQERLSLKLQQSRKVDAFFQQWGSRPGQRFPSFKDWLSTHGSDEEMKKWRYKRSHKIIAPADEEQSQAAPIASKFVLNLRDQQRALTGLRAWQQNGATYYSYEDEANNQAAPQVAFIDYGRRIGVITESDNSILASLQIALNRWGKIVVEGDRDFKDRCFQLAHEHGLKLGNSDYQDYLDSLIIEEDLAEEAGDGGGSVQPQDTAADSLPSSGDDPLDELPPPAWDNDLPTEDQIKAAEEGEASSPTETEPPWDDEDPFAELSPPTLDDYQADTDIWPETEFQPTAPANTAEHTADDQLRPRPTAKNNFNPESDLETQAKSSETGNQASLTVEPEEPAGPGRIVKNNLNSDPGHEMQSENDELARWAEEAGEGGGSEQPQDTAADSLPSSGDDPLDELPPPAWENDLPTEDQIETAAEASDPTETGPPWDDEAGASPAFWSAEDPFEDLSPPNPDDYQAMENLWSDDQADAAGEGEIAAGSSAAWAEADPFEELDSYQAQNPTWDNYQVSKSKFYDTREKYLADRKNSSRELRNRQTSENKELKAKQREEYRQLDQLSMNGQEKNSQRRKLALAHMKEKIALNITQAHEKEDWRKKCPDLPSVPFPRFKDWKLLVKDGLIETLETVDAIRPATKQVFDDDQYIFLKNLKAEYEALEGLQAIPNGRHLLYVYSSDDEDTDLYPAFIDYGGQVGVFSYDKNSILAALKMSVAKWGAIAIEGEEDFQALCRQVAAEHGITLGLPEKTGSNHLGDYSARPTTVPDMPDDPFDHEIPDLEITVEMPIPGPDNRQDATAYSESKSAYEKRLEKYLLEKTAAQSHLLNRQRHDYSILIEQQKRNRAELEKTPLKGKDKNQRRKELAHQHNLARANFRSRQVTEEMQFQRSWPVQAGAEFPSYEAWRRGALAPSLTSDDYMKKKTDTAAASILDNFREYHRAVQADRYRVTAIKMSGGQKMTMVLDRKSPGGTSEGFTPEELEKKARRIEQLVQKGENIYFTPISEDTHHILIDDLDTDSLDRLKQSGFSPCVIIASSIGNYQALINVPKIMSGQEKNVANKMTKALNEEFGDKNFFGAVHPHRAPGTTNFKENRRYPDGSYPEVVLISTEPGLCAKAMELSEKLNAEFVDYAGREEDRRREYRQRRQHELPSTVSPFSAYESHARDLLGYYGGGADYSRIDSMIALRMRVTGYSQAEIAQAITELAPGIRPDENAKKHSSWSSYAERTAAGAFSADGDRAKEKWGHYANRWLEIEGRQRREGQVQDGTHKYPTKRVSLK